MHLSLFYCHFVCSSVPCLKCHRSKFFLIGSIASRFCTFSEVEACDCPCGQNRVLFVSEDLHKMEAASQKFEQEFGILEEVQQQRGQSDCSSLPTKLLPCMGGDKYISYCDISFEKNAEPTVELHDQPQENGIKFIKFDAPAETPSPPAPAACLGSDESFSLQIDVSVVFLNLKFRT